MSENISKNENQKKQFDEEQYQILRRCFEKRDIAGWNDWRKVNKRTNVHLEGANLSCVGLEEANLSRANLQGAKLFGANLQDADLSGANLEGADLRRAIFTEKI